MIYIGNTLYADPGKTIKRIYDGALVGIEYSPGYVYYKNGVKLNEPFKETSEDFVDITKNEVQEMLGYAEKVDEYVRERYTISDELAIQRQRDTKSGAFEEYFKYCEECKKRAAVAVGLDQIEFAE